MNYEVTNAYNGHQLNLPWEYVPWVLLFLVIANTNYKILKFFNQVVKHVSILLILLHTFGGIQYL